MKIKENAEDFRVEEVIEVPKTEGGDYTYFWLKKKNWNTTKAIKKISNQCRVSLKRFGWAGNKDKKALTKQLVSAWKVEPKTLREVSLRDVEIEVLGKGKERINLGDLERNKFSLTIKDLKDSELSNFKTQFDLIKNEGFPNYFGEQRFGRGNTHLIGKEIVKGRIQRAVKKIITYQSEENEEARKGRAYAKEHWEEWSNIIKKMPKWFHIEKAILNHMIKHKNDYAGGLRELPKKLMKLYVHAYQSYFFNKILSRLLEDGKEVGVKHFTLNFPTSKFEVPEKLPLAGYKTELKKDRVSRILKELLKKENVKLEEFRCKRTPELKSRGIKRKSRAIPVNLEFEELESDKLNLSFELPSGTYATILIRSLFLEDLK